MPQLLFLLLRLPTFHAGCLAIRPSIGLCSLHRIDEAHFAHTRKKTFPTRCSSSITTRHQHEKKRFIFIAWKPKKLTHRKCIRCHLGLLPFFFSHSRVIVVNSIVCVKIETFDNRSCNRIRSTLLSPPCQPESLRRRFVGCNFSSSSPVMMMYGRARKDGTFDILFSVLYCRSIPAYDMTRITLQTHISGSNKFSHSLRGLIPFSVGGDSFAAGAAESNITKYPSGK